MSKTIVGKTNMGKTVKMFVLGLGVVLFSSGAFADGHMMKENGMISKKSHHSVKVTLDRLEAALKKKGIGVALRWSHDEKGKGVGIPLRPTELLMFGNPKLGTHMFTSNQTAGIDLPLKALAWEDEKGQVWLTYNDPAYVANRHGIKDRPEILKKMSAALDNLSTAATQP